MKRLLKYTLIALAAILVLPAAFLCGLYLTALSYGMENIDVNSVKK